MSTSVSGETCFLTVSSCPYGWMKEESIQSLRITTVPVDTPLAPTCILDVLTQVKPYASLQDVDVTVHVQCSVPVKLQMHVKCLWG